MDSDISFAVSTRMPHCPILTFEDDSTKDKSDCNSFLLVVLSKYIYISIRDYINIVHYQKHCVFYIHYTVFLFVNRDGIYVPSPN